MKIKEITSRNRRDFTAILKCEHCWNEDILRSWYDDSYYHNNVIPNIKCKTCNQKAWEDYKPKQTKYSEWDII